MSVLNRAHEPNSEDFCVRVIAGIASNVQRGCVWLVSKERRGNKISLSTRYTTKLSKGTVDTAVTTN